MKRNIAYKADGTEETGNKIIYALLSVGGKNKYNYGCRIEEEFCFLDDDGNITFNEKLPFCYELESINHKTLASKKNADYDQKLFDASCAALAGILSNQKCGLIVGNVASDSINIAKELVNQLNKE